MIEKHIVSYCYECEQPLYELPLLIDPRRKPLCENCYKQFIGNTIKEEQVD